ncbi:hypothetical protein BCR37DRAFT_395238 [Protomyces lactucae-debilis]|uniref:Uncharacterized protein n=1 Tax=Protomyces lactucae-debilis TaxID=2754530 RepID=A0A1Y2EYS5_PROLT|nr:uncharacterized protein BCR37DRAFT_395238 [Protomyces lactucae-debilis]ORY76710.1 hypothetical protein BCR37DRAFT_395238 [Protomyces lactucae-debilis]
MPRARRNSSEEEAFKADRRERNKLSKRRAKAAKLALQAAAASSAKPIAVADPSGFAPDAPLVQTSSTTQVARTIPIRALLNSPSPRTLNTPSPRTVSSLDRNFFSRATRCPSVAASTVVGLRPASALLSIATLVPAPQHDAASPLIQSNSLQASPAIDAVGLSSSTAEQQRHDENDPSGTSTGIRSSPVAIPSIAEGIVINGPTSAATKALPNGHINVETERKHSDDHESSHTNHDAQRIARLESEHEQMQERLAGILFEQKQEYQAEIERLGRRLSRSSHLQLEGMEARLEARFQELQSRSLEEFEAKLLASSGDAYASASKSMRHATNKDTHAHENTLSQPALTRLTATMEGLIEELASYKSHVLVRSDFSTNPESIASNQSDKVIHKAESAQSSSKSPSALRHPLRSIYHLIWYLWHH